MKYTVYARETWVNVFEVKANSLQEACDKVAEGKFDKQVRTIPSEPQYDAEEK